MINKESQNFREDTFLRVKRRKDPRFSYDLIVFSHLKWGFASQRPQHIINRISQHYKTLFIEEPVPAGPYSGIGFEMQTVFPNLSVLKPRIDTIAEIPGILHQLGIERMPMAWFYSPAFVGVLDHIYAEFIVYDCIKETLMFKGDPLALIGQEQRLLQAADLTLTVGNSIYREKSQYCSNVHCLPSSVDCDQFKKARDTIDIPGDIKRIKGPIIGYMGTIDKRIDMELLQDTAELMPDYNFVLIGPWSKLMDEDLARADNIHYYLGMKLYKTLPNYLRAFDVAMLPFMLNDLSHFINPAKTLEYMAAGLPVISTSISDIVYHYGDCVEIIDSAVAFKKAVKKVTSRLPVNYQANCDKILENTAWDHTAVEMLKLMKMKV